MSDQPADRMAESENALKGLQMRPGWIHVWPDTAGVRRAVRWDPEVNGYVLIPVPACCFTCQIQYDPTDPTWAPPHNRAHVTAPRVS